MFEARNKVRFINKNVMSAIRFNRPVKFAIV